MPEASVPIKKMIPYENNWKYFSDHLLEATWRFVESKRKNFLAYGIFTGIDLTIGNITIYRITKSVLHCWY